MITIIIITMIIRYIFQEETSITLSGFQGRVPSTSDVGVFLMSLPLLSNFYHIVNQSSRVTLDSKYFVEI